MGLCQKKFHPKKAKESKKNQKQSRQKILSPPIKERGGGGGAPPLLRYWLQEWVSGAGAEAVAKGAHASELVQRWRRELCPQSRPLDSLGKTRESASGASVRPARCTSPQRPAAARVP